MSKFLDYYRPDSKMAEEEVYIYAGLIIVFLFVQVVLGHYYLLTILQLGLKIRVSLSSLIYRKALKLSKASLLETTIGQMVGFQAFSCKFNVTNNVDQRLIFYPTTPVVLMLLRYSFTVFGTVLSKQ